MKSNWGIPELETTPSVIRISPDINVPITDRVKRLIDTPAFRRLSRISQLGLVAFVYPGATHSRQEHSLGVYRNAIEFLQRLSGPEALGEVLSEYDVKVFLVAALLHDVGHWPFCHVIEDMHLEGIPKHETLARRLITQSEIAVALERDWLVAPSDVADLLSSDSANTSTSHLTTQANRSQKTTTMELLQSMLSGPVDIDKLDYLERDSLHAGVPYGRNFDRNRLVNSLCIDSARNRLAITDKGRTAAEMMVFARYVMFSEVYWHHAVRSASAMLQRAAYAVRNDTNLTQSWIDMNESQMIVSLMASSQKQSWEPCVVGLFGNSRELYKRVAQFDFMNHPQEHRAIARKPYSEIVDLSARAAAYLEHRSGVSVGPHDILIDAPPAKLEVQCQLDVRQRDGSYRTLGELSPVVHALATKQFDDIVKRVRVFVRPHLRTIAETVDWASILMT